MANEICPHCRALRDTVESTVEREIEEDGNIFNVLCVYTYKLPCYN